VVNHRRSTVNQRLAGVPESSTDARVERETILHRFQETDGLSWWVAPRRFSMRKLIPLIAFATLLAAPAAFAQYQGQDQSKSTTQGYKPSADNPAKQKERNKDYSKVPGAPGNKSGEPAQQNR
jgi:hypothetical protein